MIKNENLIKRYLLERAYEESSYIYGEEGESSKIASLYSDFLKGNIKIDEKEFDLWLRNLSRNKLSFGKYLKDSGCFDGDKEIVEVSESEITSLSGIYLPTKRDVIISSAGLDCYDRPSQKYSKGHLLINGMYDNQMIYIIKAAQKGSFSIGYYGQNDLRYTKIVLEYYKQLKSVLNSIVGRGKIEVIEDNILGNDKIYVLNYKTNRSNQLTKEENIDELRVTYSNR